MIKYIKEDIKTVIKLDSAARNWLEVILTYPGIHAVWGYRIAHFLESKTKTCSKNLFKLD